MPGGRGRSAAADAAAEWRESATAEVSATPRLVPRSGTRPARRSGSVRRVGHDPIETAVETRPRWRPGAVGRSRYPPGEPGPGELGAAAASALDRGRSGSTTRSTTSSRSDCSRAATRPVSGCPPRALRGEFGVSKQPVMEALRRLSGDGLVEIVPQVGSRVAALRDRARWSDFFVMFGGFEGTIAGIAALRRTDAQLARARPHLRADRRPCGRATDPAERAHGYRVWNRRFHQAIHDMAHSRIMAETSRRMWDLSDFLINTTGCPAAAELGPGRAARRPRAHPRRPAGRRPGHRPRRDGTAHRRHRRRHSRRDPVPARRGNESGHKHGHRAVASRTWPSVERDCGKSEPAMSSRMGR